MSSNGEISVVPELLACTTELLDYQILETDHVVFVSDFVHLGVGDELLGRVMEPRGFFDVRVTLWTNEVAAFPAAIRNTLVIDTPGLSEYLSLIILGASVRKWYHVDYALFAFQSFLPCLYWRLWVTFCREVVLTIWKAMIVLALIQILYQELDDGWFVLRKVNGAVVRFLVHVSHCVQITVSNWNLPVHRT